VLIMALQWDNANSNWQKTGHVTDQADSGGKKRYEGKDYDYVFDVDIKEGSPPLKLPYNVNGTSLYKIARAFICMGSRVTTENTFTAAQRFLDRHQLPMSYLDQVADFISKNVGTPALSGGGEEFQDPFTGMDILSGASEFLTVSFCLRRIEIPIISVSSCDWLDLPGPIHRGL
jgi:phospholipase A-2-activating protein